MIAAQTIQLGSNHIVVAGGMESMSNAPKYLTTRTGSRLGHDAIIDGMIKDGLWDVYNDFGMGVCGELCADTYNITRQDQVPPALVHLLLPTHIYLLLFSRIIMLLQVSIVESLPKGMVPSHGK